jgi:hypothetical protein
MEEPIDTELTAGRGYRVLKSMISSLTIETILGLDLEQRRGKTADGIYWADFHEGARPDLALWWSGQVKHEDPVRPISDLCLDPCRSTFVRPVVYSADVIVNTAANRTKVYPHQDTPYRFPQWSGCRELLAIQFLIPLSDFTKTNGATALVPGSYRYQWNIDQLYAAVYDQWFLDNLEQVTMQIGDILVYNPRLVHSTMPNLTDRDRRALLISIMDQQLSDTLIDVDNIWI